MSLENDLTSLKQYSKITNNVSGSAALTAGLPWTNPLKITIGSDEHILDTTINRGLMMLLNNDYYLDMKEELISQELSAVMKNNDVLYDTLEKHLQDTQAHGNSGTIVNHNYYTTVISGNTDNTIDDTTTFNNQGILTEDKVVYLSITESAAAINTKISNIPHNLNGHNLAFIFVVPSDYNPIKDQSATGIHSEDYDEYSLDVR